jgi:hypothetical protein
MLSLLIAVKLWASKWEGGTVFVNIHGSNIIDLLETGRSRDPVLLSLAREIWMGAATHAFNIVPVKYVDTTMGKRLNEIQVPEYFFKLCENL